MKRRGSHLNNNSLQKDRKKTKTNKHRCGNKGERQKESLELKGRKREEERSSRGKNLLLEREKIEIQDTKIKDKGKSKCLEVKNRGTTVAKSKEKAKITEVVGEQREKRGGIFRDEANTVIQKVEYKNFKKEMDIETLPSTSDFIRFMSLDYSNGLNLELLNVNM